MSSSGSNCGDPAFEALLKQIATLEKAQHEQEAKLAAEAASHNTTKAELHKATRLEERWKAKLAELQGTCAQVKAALTGEERRNQQLKDEVRRLKDVSNTQQQSKQKEEVGLKKERDSFLEAMEGINNEMRGMHAENKGLSPTKRSLTPSNVVMAAPVSLHQGKKADLEAKEALQKRIEALDLEIKEAIEKSSKLVASIEQDEVGEDDMNMDPSPSQSCQPPADEVISHGPSTGLAEGAMVQETEELKHKSEEYVVGIEKLKHLHSTTLAEYKELDKYVNTLTASLEELQAYCTQLENLRMPCTVCGGIKLLGDGIEAEGGGTECKNADTMDLVRA